MTSQLFRFLHRRCSSDQGSPSSCKCGGSSRAETEASWPCHYSSTRASPQQEQVCQFHESGEKKNILDILTETFDLLPWADNDIHNGAFPCHSSPSSSCQGRPEVRHCNTQTTPHTTHNQLVTHLQADVTDAVTRDKGM